jgi:hypothetical protein
MPWNREKRSLMHNASVEGFTGPDATRSTFSDTYPAFLTKTINSELSISRHIMGAPKRDRNSEVFRMIRDGEIPESVVQNFLDESGSLSSVFNNTDALADYLIESGYVDSQTTAEIDESIKEEIHFYEGLAADALSRASASGYLGMFAGGMHAGMLDPVNVAVSLAIPAAGPASTLWGTAAKHAGIGAAAGLGAEALIQPVIMGYKKEVGLEYTFSDALTNASLSAIMGGTISGASGALGHAVTDSLNNARIARQRGDIDAAEGWEAAYQIARQMDIESRNAPEPDVAPIDFDRAVVQAGEVIDSGVNIPVRQNVEPVNVETAIKQEIVDETPTVSTERYELLEEQARIMEREIQQELTERGGVGLAEPGYIVSARARFEELEGKMAIAITCLKGQ